jgi:hypothetical protein
MLLKDRVTLVRRVPLEDAMIVVQVQNQQL